MHIKSLNKTYQVKQAQHDIMYYKGRSTAMDTRNCLICVVHNLSIPTTDMNWKHGSYNWMGSLWEMGTFWIQGSLKISACGFQISESVPYGPCNDHFSNRLPKNNKAYPLKSRPVQFLRKSNHGLQFVRDLETRYLFGGRYVEDSICLSDTFLQLCFELSSEATCLRIVGIKFASFCITVII